MGTLGAKTPSSGAQGTCPTCHYPLDAPLLLRDMTMSNTAGVLKETWPAYPSWAPGFSPGFWFGVCLPSVSCDSGFQCYLCFWVVYTWLPIWFSLTLIYNTQYKIYNKPVCMSLSLLPIPSCVFGCFRCSIGKCLQKKWYNSTCVQLK